MSIRYFQRIHWSKLQHSSPIDISRICSLAHDIDLNLRYLNIEQEDFNEVKSRLHGLKSKADVLLLQFLDLLRTELDLRPSKSQWHYHVYFTIEKDFKGLLKKMDDSLLSEATVNTTSRLFAFKGCVEVVIYSVVYYSLDDSIKKLRDEAIAALQTEIAELIKKYPTGLQSQIRADLTVCAMKEENIKRRMKKMNDRFAGLLYECISRKSGLYGEERKESSFEKEASMDYNKFLPDGDKKAKQDPLDPMVQKARRIDDELAKLERESLDDIDRKYDEDKEGEVEGDETNG